MERQAQEPKADVLVVDDERFHRVTLREALEEGGYAVREAADGESALVEVRRRLPDIVLLDVVMTGIDGFETCRQMRRQIPENQNLPILMVTALEDVETVERAYAAGATDYVTKPIIPAHLRHHLRYVLRASRHLAELRQNEARLAAAQRLAKLGNWAWQPDTETFTLSDEARRILGWSAADEPSLNAFLDLIPEPERAAVADLLRAARQERRSGQRDHRILRRDGTVRSVHTQVEPNLHDAGVTATLQDITERKRVEEKLLLAGRVFDSSGEMILVADAEGLILETNPAYSKLTGFGPEEVLGTSIRALQTSRQDPDFFQELWETVEATGTWQGEVWNRRQNGESFPALVTINAVRNDRGETTHYVVVGTDISALRKTEQRLRYLSNFDPLTDLPNRVLFLDRLQRALIVAARNRGMAAVLLFDIDNFKEINDTLGHEAGDATLRLMAQRLVGYVRKSDTVARMGSDEFALVLSDLAHSDNGALVAQRVLEVLARPFTVEGQEIYATVSIGIALAPADSEQAEGLVKKAETALAFAKSQGKNRFQFFSARMNTRTRERLELKTDLRRGIERDELLLHYQAKYDSQGGTFTGLEALARWQHPQRGLVPPLKFIPLAEETGLIVALGAKVLGLACSQNLAWQQAGFDPFRVAVNLSAYQFRQSDLVAEVRQALDRTGLAPEWLELEITESAIMQDTDRAVAILKQLKEMGIRIAMDDFGTGYSSLSYLKRFPVDVLKIDYSFVHNIFVDAEDAAIVKAIIAMAKSLRLVTIAEGVETEEQRVFLREQGCDEVQGYLAGMPSPAAEIEPFLPRRLKEGNPE